VVSVAEDATCNTYKPVGATKSYSTGVTGDLNLLQGATLVMTGITTTSLSMQVAGVLNIDTMSTVNLTIATANFLSTYKPYSIVLIEATSCPNTAVVFNIISCPSWYACTAALSSTTSKLTLTLTPTNITYSTNYWTLQLNMDCSMYTPDWFISVVSQFYSAATANALVVDPPSCGSVYQSFRCKSYTSAVAQSLCLPFYTNASTYNSVMWNLLGVYYGWQLYEPVRPSNSNYSLHALFAIFAAPVGGVLAYGFWKEHQKRKKSEELGAYSTESDYSPNVARPVKQ
jgi:hypothetical protein